MWLSIHSYILAKPIPDGQLCLGEFLNYLSIMNEKIQISALTRVAIRYENRFSGGWKQFIDFARFPSYMAALKYNASFYTSLIQLDKSDHYLLFSVYMPQDTNELQVDYDAFTSTSSPAEQLKEVLETLHTTVEKEFLTSID